jgi:dipeptidyl aminopeptidase/acylaminoacyl peptidase
LGRYSWAAIAVILIETPFFLWAQGTRADYDRANKMPALTRNKVYKARVQPHWLAGNTRFWYRNDLAGGARAFVVVDAVNGKKEPAFDHERLAAALSKQTGKTIQATHLPFDELDFLEKPDAIRFTAAAKTWQWDRANNTLKEDQPSEAKPPPDSGPPARQRQQPRGNRPSPSPDGKWVAFIKDYNVHVREGDAKESTALSKDGTAEDGYSGRVYWSPDSKKLVVLRTKRVEERKIHLIESSPRDKLQPKLHTLAYPKPGDTLPIGKPRLFDVAAKKEIPIRDDLFPNAWSITQLRWDKDSNRFTFLYNQRGHQVLRVIAVDAETGKASTIVDEKSRTFIDYAHKSFLRHLDATHELIWMSERDGWNHLYLYDAKTGKVKNQITKGDWVVRGIDRVDGEKRQIWFRAGGIHAGQDPYHIHSARVNFDGGGLVTLTDGDGTHTIDYSPDRRYVIDTYSRVDLPPVTELRKVEDGKLIGKLENADISALKATGWRVPERFVAKGRDGKTDIYGVIFRPSNFDPNKKYPVIEDIYAGPQGAFVPKRFSPFHYPQALAELGFIVVKIDGMGTSYRSKAFHDVCWKDLGDAGFPDRILWIKSAAAKYPYMDLSRVGIYGTSAGGQSSLGGLLTHPDFYKVGVSACGCHDNRMDKVWWNELWMGWPVGPHYAEQSNVTNAHKLQGKLLLIVGEMDRNVDPASTMQVVNALIKANKDFDLLVVPGGGHGMGGAYGVRRQRDFFVRHLLGVEPRHEP